LLGACYYLITKGCDTGIYNITNTGSMTTKEITKCNKIPSQRFINKKKTCDIISDLVDKIYSRH